ncbi:MAG TPA: GTP 3',8-cyclase MoaA [Sphingobium sp.]|uniref:GTP 3',8-cyclase MoaA n=1 Tax=Sphingobium sp. TaxID=1912891 RepID=UPI002ED49832
MADNPSSPVLTDRFGRRIDYVRLSVTDRCDLRCRYCMAEEMSFLPKTQILTLDEIGVIADRFIRRGVRRIRLSGGEPLVRRDFTELAHRIGRNIGHGLDELTLTTNGTQLARFAGDLHAAGMRRINVSLDSLKAEVFAHISRRDRLAEVLEGITVASAEGLAIKINMVVMRGVNDGEVLDMLRWCGAHDHDLTLIETMPLGQVSDDRTNHYMPLHEAIAPVRAAYDIMPIDYHTGGPARYFSVEGLRTKLGLITPMSDNFCSGCNRMRLTCQGRIYMCLGHEDHVDLMSAFRAGGVDAVDALLDEALGAKPLRHDFAIGTGLAPATRRHMNVTGG